MKVTIIKDNSSLTLESDETQPIPMIAMIEDLEKEVITQVLAKHNGVKARAAPALKFNRTTLVERCRRYGFPLNIKE